VPFDVTHRGRVPRAAAGTRAQRPDASLFRCVRLPQCLEGALQGTSRIGRWACAEIAVSAGQCSHPFQVSAGISSAQAEQSHHPCLNELSSRRTGWGVVHHEYSNDSRALGTVCSLWTLWSSARAASLPSNARLHRTTVKHTAGGQRLGRLACFATQKKTRNHILLAYAISSSSVGAETGHAVHFQTCAKQRSCHFTTRFHPPTQRAKRNRRGNFGGASGRWRRVRGFDGHMDGMLTSAEDALSEKRYHSAFRSAIALKTIDNAVC
jgi:hypothetical protein